MKIDVIIEKYPPNIGIISNIEVKITSVVDISYYINKSKVSLDSDESA